MTRRPRIAVIGTGITGLGAAYALRHRADLTLYEKAPRLGGHSQTVAVDYDGTAIPVDTGFIVYNEINYPRLTALFAELGIATAPSRMSFAVSARGGAVEWGGDSLATVFAQRRNLLSPPFLGMLADILRFNRAAVRDLDAGRLAGRSLGGYAAGYGTAFRRDYLLPMGAAIWSTPVADMMAFPAESFVRFFRNHALLKGLEDRHQWRTVRGGSSTYVTRLAGYFTGRIRSGRAVAALVAEADGVTVVEAGGHRARFDQVIVATHADEALAMIAAPSPAERAVLGAFRYAENHAVLHRDSRLMPRRRGVWSSWNYLSAAGSEGSAVTLTYWMNRLQNIDPAKPLFVSLNPHVPPDPAKTFFACSYHHPMFDRPALEAQGRLAGLQGRRGLWFGGAYCGNGFHEDGLAAGQAIARAILAGLDRAVPATVAAAE